ncbi:MAG: alginate export family protein [Myxococcota bacterium]
MPRATLLSATIVVLVTMGGAASLATAQEAAPEPPSSADPEAAELPGAVVGGVRWTPTAQIWPRLEIRVNRYQLGPDDQEDIHFLTMRSRIGLGASAGPVRALVQVQDVRLWGEAGPGAVAGSMTGLFQGYLEVGDEDRGWIRAGRQAVNYGKQRLIGALDWTSPARSFDAVRAHGRFGKLEVDAMGAYLGAQDVLVAGDDNLAVEGDYLGTLYLTYAIADWLELEPYVLYRHDEGFITEDPVPGAPAIVDRVRNLASPGVRATGVVHNLDYDVELVFQTGRSAVDGVDETLLAFAAVAEVGYGFEGSLGPALRVGGAYATGEDDDGKVNELDNFFPTNHMHYGIADLFGLRNLLWGFVRGDLKPEGAPVNATLSAHVFGLANPDARWSDAGGRTIGLDPANQDRLLGAEVDAEAIWKPLDQLAVAGGYSIFVPSQGAQNLDNDAVQHWMYVQANGQFR